MKTNKLTKEKINLIKSMESKGFLKVDIANQLNIAISCVCKYTPKSRRQMDDADRAKIVELYALGKTQIEIGKIVGFSRDTVARVTKDLPKRKKPHKKKRELKTKPAGVPVPKIKKLTATIRKDKVNNSGKEVNVRRLETKPRPPVYKKIRIDSKTEIETYSEKEYLEKISRYGIN